MNFKNFYTLLAALLLVATTAQAQLYFEDFGSAEGPVPSDMTIYDLDGATSTGLGGDGNPVLDASFLQWSVVASTVVDGEFVAAVTSWINPTGAADDWLVTPQITGITANTVLQWEAAARDADFADGYEVYISTGGNAVADFTATTPVFTIANENAGTFTKRTVDLSTYAGQSIYVAFRNNSNDQFILELDNIFVGEPSDDASVEGIQPEYFRIPAYLMPDGVPLMANVSSEGGTDLTGVVVTVNVYQDSLNTTPIDSYTSTGVAVAAGTTEMVNVGTFPTTTGAYLFEYVVSADQADGDDNNNTFVTAQIITDSIYGRDAGTTGTIGIGAGGQGLIGNTFDVPVASELHGAVFATGAQLIGDGARIQVYLWDEATDSLGAFVATSSEVTFTAQDTVSGSTNVFTVDFDNGTGGPILVPQGARVFVAIEEDASVDNIGVVYSEDIFTPATTYVSINGGANFGPSEDFGFPVSYFIRPIMSAQSTDVDPVAASSIEASVFPNPAREVAYMTLSLETATEVYLSVYSADGKEVFTARSGENTNHNFEMGVQDLANGVYLARFTVGGEVITKPVIVNK